MPRQKGSKNAITKSVKEAITLAFDELGGVDELVRWAKKEQNRPAFYHLWGRLAPREVHADVTVKLSPEERARRVAQLLGVSK